MIRSLNKGTGCETHVEHLKLTKPGRFQKSFFLRNTTAFW